MGNPQYIASTQAPQAIISKCRVFAPMTLLFPHNGQSSRSQIQRCRRRWPAQVCRHGNEICEKEENRPWVHLMRYIGFPPLNLLCTFEFFTRFIYLRLNFNANLFSSTSEHTLVIFGLSLTFHARRLVEDS